MKTEDLMAEIERNRRMSELAETPRQAHDYCSAMPDKEMINRYIEYLINQSEAKDLQIRSLEIKIDELTGKITSLLEEKQKEGNRMKELITELRSMNAELSKSRKKIAKLEEQLKAAKADKYGKSRRRSKYDDTDSGMDPTDRTEADDIYDGSDADTSNPMSSDEKECRNSSATGQTFNTANRPETYKSMGVNGRKIVHKSDRSRIPEGSRVIETNNVVLYSLEMSLVAHEYEMLHVVEPGKKPVWKYYPKDGLFLYSKDGSYPIDNNLAERSVRPFTTKRKCSLHFGSDEGAEMSADYHSIISTLKLCGKSVWNFFGDYFRCEVLGLDTYKEYLSALSR